MGWIKHSTLPLTPLHHTRKQFAPFPQLPLHHYPYTICTIKHHYVHLQSMFNNRGNPMLFMNSFPRSSIILHTAVYFARKGEMQCYLWTVSHDKTSNLQLFDKIFWNCYRDLFYLSSQIVLTGYCFVISLTTIKLFWNLLHKNSLKIPKG